MRRTRLDFLLLPVALALVPATFALATPPATRAVAPAQPGHVHATPPAHVAKPAWGRLRNLYDPAHAADLAKTSAQRLTDAELTEEQYVSIRGAGVELVNRFPPADHFYISLGRSATQLVAFLQDLNPEIAINLPASGLGSAPDATLEPAYFEHFQKMIPDSVLESGKKIVLMDLAVSGGSLRNAEKLLRSYLQHRGFKNELDVVTFTSSATTIKGALDQDYHNIVLSDGLSPLYNIMSGNEKGEYPEYHVGTTAPSALQRLDFYMKQKDALLHRMQHDEELSKQTHNHH